MGYSGLIYAAIVAGWAAILVPRWIRRNEEVERAREEDAARGVRVLDRQPRTARSAHPAGSFTFSGPDAELVPEPHVAVGAPTDPDRADHPSTDGSDGASAPAERPAGVLPGVAHFGVAAKRRRRVLLLLTIALVVVLAGSIAGRLPSAAALVPAGLLAGFLVLARRAAIAEQHRRARIVRAMRRKAAEATPVETPAEPRRRVAVLDVPEPSEPADPDAWEPVPVPLPTYLTKAKAPTPVVRKIDLSRADAWTSGRLDPAGSVAMPPPPAQPAPETAAEEPEHRRAVGD